MSTKINHEHYRWSPRIRRLLLRIGRLLSKKEKTFWEQWGLYIHKASRQSQELLLEFFWGGALLRSSGSRALLPVRCSTVAEKVTTDRHHYQRHTPYEPENAQSCSIIYPAIHTACAIMSSTYLSNRHQLHTCNWDFPLIQSQPTTPFRVEV